MEQIGYYERVSEAAVQYAERLLATKPALVDHAADIARQMVYSYKAHGFVIDAEEATRLLGNDWVFPWSKLELMAEGIYRLFEWVNLWLGVHQKKRLIVTGSISLDGTLIVPK